MLLPINDYFQKSLDSSKPIIMNIIDFFNEYVNNDEEPFYISPFRLPIFHYSIIGNCRINQERSVDHLASAPRFDYWKAILCEHCSVNPESKFSEERPLVLVKG